ncbi:hypothetical protein RFI_25232 [Reticulomyxa filosa]|uniref:Exportin-T n=1 Tax=Reticulomyxa filosa TaxID=46433 RepID=X6MEP2_RETFI|nr:hypothetical protein RFI_25232 [Reticulomyxa filosa]|eukprot:ETO12146.1 hypothetical protein RFI_25232 [Reticulomyxa filosa]
MGLAEQQIKETAGLFLNNMKSCIDGQNEWERVNPALTGRVMSECISCLSSLFKSCKVKMSPLLSILFTATEMVLRAYSCLPNDEILRKESICFFHQSQSLLKEGIFFQIFIKSSNETNIVSTLQIFSQIVGNVGNHKDVIDILDVILVPLLDTINQSILARFEHVTSEEVSQSQDFHLKVDILRHFYLFLGKILELQCFVILMSSRNASMFQRVVGQLLRDCVPSQHNDLSLNKQCFLVFKEMVSKFKKSNPQLENIFLTHLIKATFDFVLSPQYKPKDAAWDRTLGKAILALYNTLFNELGTSKAGNAIGKYLISELNAPTQAVQQFCHLIPDYPQSENQLKQFMLVCYILYFLFVGFISALVLRGVQLLTLLD